MRNRIKGGQTKPRVQVGWIKVDWRLDGALSKIITMESQSIKAAKNDWKKERKGKKEIVRRARKLVCMRIFQTLLDKFYTNWFSGKV